MITQRQIEVCQRPIHENGGAVVVLSATGRLLAVQILMHA
jgi:hypothetical protein